MDTQTSAEIRARSITDESRRAELLAAYEASGLTQKAFAARAGINYHTFISWLVQQRRAAESSAPPAAETRDGTKTARLEVTLPGSIVVRGDNPAAIARLIHSLRQSLVF